jgi:hypothetical protein
VTNGSWSPVWNERSVFVEEVVKLNTLDDEYVSVSTSGNPNLCGPTYEIPKIGIYYESIRNKKRINRRWDIPPELLCELSDSVVVLIIKELLKAARYDEK